ncbi:MAG: GSCFA family protein, partial [Pseudomonadota bacterium]
MSERHPYEDLPARAFWRSAVAGRAPGDLAALYRPRFPISSETRIFTAGSCFAQHVGRALQGAGY